MKRAASHSATVIWLLLITLTLLSIGIAEKGLFGKLSFVAIVLLAAAKSRIIILDYMEAKHAPKHWRFLYETWNFSMAAVIIIGNSITLTKLA